MSDNGRIVVAQVDVLIAKVNETSMDGRTLSRSGAALPAGPVVAWGWTGGTAPVTEHLGSAAFTLTGDGLVARLSVSPVTARRLLDGDLRAALECESSRLRMRSGTLVADQWEPRGVFIGKATTTPAAWRGLWVREVTRT